MEALLQNMAIKFGNTNTLTNYSTTNYLTKSSSFHAHITVLPSILSALISPETGISQANGKEINKVTTIRATVQTTTAIAREIIKTMKIVERTSIEIQMCHVISVKGMAILLVNVVLPRNSC